MKHSRWLVSLFGLSLVFALASAAPAKEEAEKFLDRLHDRGYGEVMLDYLDYLKQFNLLPEDVAANWDLYQSRGWRMSIGESFNEKEVEDRTTKAKTFLDKYLKDHPDSPEVGEEVVEWGDMSFKAGLRLLGQARITKDKEKKDALTLKARTAFEEARPRFEQSIEVHRKNLTALQAAAGNGGSSTKGKPKAVPAGKQAAIDDAELMLTDAQLKLAKAGFFLGQTYADDETAAGKAARKTALEKARKDFSDIYQRYRTGAIGLMAHTFEGKTSEELGDTELAKEMYDEVLALMPPGSDKTDRNQEMMFSQVQYFYFMIVLKTDKDGAKAMLPEAREWLKQYEKWQRTDGYQGIALEVARADVDLLEKGGGDQKGQVRKEVDTILKLMKKIPSEYHRDGMELAKELNKKAGGGGPPKTYEEAIANGDDFFGAHKWQEAIDSYETALKMVKGFAPAKRKEVKGQVDEKLETCRYNQVYELFSTGKDEEALAAIASLMEEKQISAKGDTAGKLAALRVHIILRRYASSRDAEAKEKLLTELSEAAAAVIEKWPDKPAADDARIAMAQAAMVQGKVADAITQFESVNPRSERYPTALYMAAQGWLKLWNIERQKPSSDRDAKLVKQASAKAIEDLEKSVEIQTAGITPGQALPPQLIECELVLGQVYLESGDAKKTAELLQPVVDSIKAAKPEKLDGTMLKVFNTTVKAYVVTGDMTKGGEVATLLTDLGEDIAEVNSVLVAFARMLDAEYKQASATLIEAKAENDLAAREAAEARLAGTKELLGKILERLAPRKNNTPVSMISIGDMATEIGLGDLASEIYNRIITESANNQAFADQCGKNGLVRVRAQLVELLRQKGQYEEGLKQVNALIDEVPKALEPMMTKGRILQAWGEKDPAKFTEAVSHWAALRQKLAPHINKPGTPADLKSSYYEINYNVALCLFSEAQKTANTDKAFDAQKVLNGLLIPSPKLDGPETVAKYRDLLKKCEEFVKKGQKAPAAPATTAARK